MIALDQFFDEAAALYPNAAGSIAHVRGICTRLEEGNDVEHAVLDEIEDIAARRDLHHLDRTLRMYKRFGKMLDALKAFAEPRTN